jgi:hypothetical protein
LYWPGVSTTTTGSRTPRGAHAAQRLQQELRVVLDRRDVVVAEELGKEPHHHAAVLEHVGDARGRAQIVLEDVVLAVAVPHDVHACDVAVDLVRQVETRHRHLVRVVRQHLLGGNHARAQDLLAVVDVVQETIERRHALAQPLLQQPPLGARDDARDGIERDQPLGAVLVTVDGERDADAVKQEIGFAPLLDQAFRGQVREPFGQRLVVAARDPAGFIHLVEAGSLLFYDLHRHGWTTSAKPMPPKTSEITAVFQDQRNPRAPRRCIVPRRRELVTTGQRPSLKS